MSDQAHDPSGADAQEQPSVSLLNDPVIEEVRAIRRRLWEESGRDIRRYIERSFEAEERRRGERPKGGRGDAKR